MPEPEENSKPQPLGAESQTQVNDANIDDTNSQLAEEVESPNLDTELENSSDIDFSHVLDGTEQVDSEALQNSEQDLDPDEPENLISREWLGAQLNELSAAFTDMAKRFDVVTTQSKRVHEINGKMNAELQTLRGNAMLEMMRPGFGGFVRLIGQLDTDIEKLRSTDNEMVNTLLAYRTNLSNALQDCGLIEDSPTPLDEPTAFSPTTHEINTIVPTDDRDKNQIIVRSVLPGFSFGDRSLFREKVDVYRFKTSLSNEKDR